MVFTGIIVPPDLHLACCGNEGAMLNFDTLIPKLIVNRSLNRLIYTIIIMSGDSDYIELVHHLKSEGVRVEIATVKETTSALLKEEADYFHPIVEEDWFILGGCRPMGRGGKFKRHPREGFKSRNDEISADVEVDIDQDHDEDRDD